MGSNTSGFCNSRTARRRRSALPKNVHLQSRASRRTLQLQITKREGLQIYLNMLRSAVSDTAYIAALNIPSNRTRKEATVLARVIDIYIDMFGHRYLNIDDHMEIVLRRF
jgi:hypothetical protein